MTRRTPEDPDDSSIPKDSERVLKANNVDELHQKALRAGRAMVELREPGGMPPRDDLEPPPLIDENPPIVLERFNRMFRPNRKPKK